MHQHVWPQSLVPDCCGWCGCGTFSNNYAAPFQQHYMHSTRDHVRRLTDCVWVMPSCFKHWCCTWVCMTKYLLVHLFP